jgi:hypothetical protein
MDEKPARKRGFRLIYLLLLLPYAAILWIPSYNHVEPALAGIPFFYWYQLLWIPLGALILLPIYLSEERDNAKGGAP